MTMLRFKSTQSSDEIKFWSSFHWKMTQVVCSLQRLVYKEMTRQSSVFLACFDFNNPRNTLHKEDSSEWLGDMLKGKNINKMHHSR